MDFDIIIVVGGMAGVCAAISAKREGDKVCLIEGAIEKRHQKN